LFFVTARWPSWESVESCVSALEDEEVAAAQLTLALGWGRGIVFASTSGVAWGWDCRDGVDEPEDAAYSCLITGWRGLFAATPDIYEGDLSIWVVSGSVLRGGVVVRSKLKDWILNPVSQTEIPLLTVLILRARRCQSTWLQFPFTIFAKSTLMENNPSHNHWTLNIYPKSGRNRTLWFIKEQSFSWTTTQFSET